MNRGIMAPPSNVRPPGLKNVAIEQRLNEQIPADLVFRDETGKAVHLSDYFGKKPLVLSLVYYRCPMLCSELLIGLESTLKVLKFDVGKLNRRMVLENTVVFGTVNANRAHYEAAAAALARADQGWLRQLITRRVPLARWSEALERRPDDIKVVLDFAV